MPRKQMIGIETLISQRPYCNLRMQEYDIILVTKIDLYDILHTDLNPRRCSSAHAPG
jgi:hypothetical protein